MLLAAVLCGCPVPHRWHLGWLVGAGTLPLQAERRDRTQEGLALCPCSFVCSLGRTRWMPAAFLGAEYISIPPFHTFPAKHSPQLSTLSALPRPCAPAARGAGHTGAAVLQGAGGTAGTPALTPG